MNVRAIEPGDKDLLVGAFDRMSEDSRYRRFFQPIHELSDTNLRFLTEVDHHDHEALVALDDDEAVGVARYVRSVEKPSRAEVAVSVVDDYQGKGVGGGLLERLVDRAREEDVTHFTALVQAANPGAVRVLSTLGATETHREGGRGRARHRAAGGRGAWASACPRRCAAPPARRCTRGGRPRGCWARRAGCTSALRRASVRPTTICGAAGAGDRRALR